MFVLNIRKRICKTVLVRSGLLSSNSARAIQPSISNTPKVSPYVEVVVDSTRFAWSPSPTPEVKTRNTMKTWTFLVLKTWPTKWVDLSRLLTIGLDSRGVLPNSRSQDLDYKQGGLKMSSIRLDSTSWDNSRSSVLSSCLQQTRGLTNRKIALHVHYNSWHIVLPSSKKKQQRKMTKAHFTRGNFSWNSQHNKRCIASCPKNCPCNTLFLQPVIKENVALQVVRKVEASSTFRSVAKKVAACDMSSTTCNATLLKWANQSASFSNGQHFKMVAEVCCKLRTKIASVWHPLCILQCFSFVRVALQVAEKIASCNMAFNLGILEKVNQDL